MSHKLFAFPTSSSENSLRKRKKEYVTPLSLLIPPPHLSGTYNLEKIRFNRGRNKIIEAAIEASFIPRRTLVALAVGKMGKHRLRGISEAGIRDAMSIR